MISDIFFLPVIMHISGLNSQIYPVQSVGVPSPIEVKMIDDMVAVCYNKAVVAVKRESPRVTLKVDKPPII